MLPTGAVQVLSEDTESEAEAGEFQSCQAVQVGIKTADGMKALTQESCTDKAQAEKVRLLESDLTVSDLPQDSGGSVVVAYLCSYHASLYKSVRLHHRCENSGTG